MSRSLPRSAAALRALVLGLACLGLAACSSDRSTEEINAATIARGVFASIFNRTDPAAPDPGEIARAAAAALARTSGQVIVLAIPDRDVLTVMQQIERNGAHVTFGTPDRRSVTLKNGIVTATRGLGNDLLSAEVDAVARLISARSEGAARRINRYLDGENLTVELDPWCQVKLAGPGAVGLGEVHVPTTRVLESCITNNRTFQNSYQVSPDGRIVQSRQWISPLNAYMVIQSLR